MPKLDLTRAIQIKGAGGNIAKLKGSGFLWEAPYLAGGEHPDLIADFEQERYLHSGEVQAGFSDLATFARASGATYTDANGVIQTASANVPRIGHHVYNGSAWVNEGLLHESEARTNSLPRNDFSGGTAGVIGSGGVAPTGVGLVNTLGSGAVTTIEGFGTELGMPYMDVRWQGTATGTPQICGVQFSGPTDVPSSPGQTWTISCFYKQTAGGFPTAAGSVFRFGLIEYTSGFFTFETVSNVANPTSTIARNSQTTTLAAAGADSVRGKLEIRVSSGTSVDVTIRYYLPQLEQGPTPSSPILTTGSAATRAAETLTIPAANLPWPAPVVIGPELVTNGTFDTDVTGWTAGSGATLSSVSGQLVVSVAGGDTFGNAYQEIPTVAGKVYQMTFDRVATTQQFIGGVSTTATSTIDLLSLSSAGGFTGTFSGVFVGTGSNVFIRAGVVDSNGGGSATFDNISVREINPLAVSIQMDGRVTYADENAYVTVQPFYWKDTSATLSLDVRISTFSTAVGRVTAAQYYPAGVGSFSDVANAYSPDVNVPINIAARFTSNSLQVAADGILDASPATPTGLPDLSATDLSLGNDYMGTIRTFRIWADDIGDAGIVEATS